MAAASRVRAARDEGGTTGNYRFKKIQLSFPRLKIGKFVVEHVDEEILVVDVHGFGQLARQRFLEYRNLSLSLPYPSPSCTARLP